MKKIKKIVSILLALLMVMPNVTGNSISVLAQDIDQYFGSGTFYLYSDDNKAPNYGSDYRFSPYYVIEKMNNNGIHTYSRNIVYCLDKDRRAPLTTSSPFTEGTLNYKNNYERFRKSDLYVKTFNGQPVSNGNLNGITSNNDPNTGFYLRRTIYNGYPQNASGLQEEFELSDMEFRSVTQAAVWYYGSHHGLFFADKEGIMREYQVSLQNDHFQWSQNAIEAYYTLTEYRNVNNVTLKNPTDSDINLYVYENADAPSYWQRMISAGSLGGYNVEVNKQWLNTPAVYPINVELYATDSYGTKVVKEAQITQVSNNKVEFTNLAEFDDQFKKITYSVREKEEANYAVTYSGNQDQGGLLITNTQRIRSANTTVHVDGKTGNGEHRLNVYLDKGKTQKDFHVTDTVNYAGLKPNTVYHYVGKLVEESTGRTITNKGQFTTSATGNGSYEVDFGMNTLSAGGYFVDELMWPASLGNNIPEGNEELVVHNGKNDFWQGFNVQKGKGTIYFQKINEKDQPLANAKFNITFYGTGNAGTVAGSFTSTSAPYELKIIPGIKYKVEETTVVPGYQKLEPFIFSVDEQDVITLYYQDGVNPLNDPNVTIDQNTLTIKMKNIPVDDKIEVSFSKVDFASNELPGAQITIYKYVSDTEKTFVTNWVSTDQPHKFKLEPGYTYIFHEEVAPFGYKVVNDIYFDVYYDQRTHQPVVSLSPDHVTISNNRIEVKDGTHLIVEDAVNPTPEVQIMKLDESGNLLAGAEVQVLTKDGQVKETWITNTTVHQMKLDAGEYIFRELNAPVGYLKVNDVPFKVAENGEITITASIPEAKVSGNTIRITDNADGKKDVIFYKKDIFGTPLAGATIEIQDQNDHNNVVFFDSLKEGNKIRLKPSVYTVTEIDAPSGHEKFEPFTLTVNQDGSINIPQDIQERFIARAKNNEVDLYDNFNKVVFQLVKKEANHDPALYLDGAIFSFKNVLTQEVITSLETTSDQGVEIALYPGTYKVNEVQTPIGYETLPEFDLTVNKDGTISTTLPEEVWVEYGLTIGTNRLNHALVITNTVKEYEFTLKKLSENVELTSTSNGLAGAIFKIQSVDENHQVIDDREEYEITTDETGIHVKLAAGTYKFTETAAPAGYQQVDPFFVQVTKDGRLSLEGTVSYAKVEDSTLLVQDEVQTKEIEIQKISENEIAIADVTIQIKQGENVIKEFTTQDGISNKFALKPGTYTFVEVSAPIGYVKVDNFEFKVNDDGTVSIVSNEITGVSVQGNQLIVVDQYREATVKFFKLKGNSDEVLSGAGFTLNRWDGNQQAFVEHHTWTTRLSGNATVVTATDPASDASESIKMEPGKYQLIETVVPDGYTAIPTIEFSVDQDGNVIFEKVDDITDQAIIQQKLGEVIRDYQPNQVINIYHPDNLELKINDGEKQNIVKIRKVDQKGERLEGVTFQLVNDHGESKQFVTTTLDSILELEPDVTYQLYEVNAPKGIDFDSTSYTAFYVNDNGELYLLVDGRYVKQDTNVLTITNQRKPIQIQKVDEYGNVVTDEHIQLTFTPENGEPISLIMNQENEYRFEPGIYTITETITNPDESVYVPFTQTVKVQINSDQTIRILEDSSNVLRINNANLLIQVVNQLKPHEYTFKKKDLNIDSRELRGSEISIVNQYTGVEVYRGEIDNISSISLKPGTYELIELSAPENYISYHNRIEFTIQQDGRVDQNSFKNATYDGVAYFEYDEGDHTFTLKNKEKEYPIYLKKVDLDSQQALAGAIFKVSNGNTVITDSYKPEEGNVLYLKVGTYTIEEVVTPAGYKTISPIKVDVTENGSVIYHSNLDIAVVEDDGSSVLTIENEFEGHEVEISKVNLGGEEIAGAHIMIKDAEESIVDQWDSVANETHHVKLKDGIYTFHEESAPNGYLTVTDITFQVNRDGNVTILQMNGNKVSGGAKSLTVTDLHDDATEVTFSKVNLGAQEVAGAKLELQGVTNDFYTIWISSDQPRVIPIEPGTYSLKEVYAPEGYAPINTFTFEVKLDGTVELKEYNSKNVQLTDQKITIVDEYEGHTVKFSKTDFAGNEIAGAKIQIWKQADESHIPVLQWTSRENVTETFTLPAGTYVFHEEAAPNGYLKVTDIVFTVSQEGIITVDEPSDEAKLAEGESNHLVVIDYYDQPKNIEISKVNLGGEEIAGAQIQIYRNSQQRGNPLYSFESTEQPTLIQLIPGSYIFHEEVAPDGYLTVSDIVFTVDENGKVTVEKITSNSDMAKAQDGRLIVTDRYAPKTIQISKVDIAGKELSGASIKITKENGEVVESWVSSDQPHSFNIEPGTYVFHEEAAPNGYLKVTDITFVVDVDGNIQVETIDGVNAQGNTLTVTDEYRFHTVKISKVNLGGEPISGAKITISGRELNQSEDITPITYTSTSDVKEISLKPGTYTFHEEVAPNGYLTVTDIEFTVTVDGQVQVLHMESNSDAVMKDGVLTITDDYQDQTIRISKVDIAGVELPGATIKITKENGELIEQWVSSDQPHSLTLKPGTYIFHEEAAPEGYAVVTDIVFTVDIHGKVHVVMIGDDQVVTDEDLLKVTDRYAEQTIQISKVNIAGDELPGASIKITKENGEFVEEWVSTNQPHLITIQPGTYVFHEEAAPNGYLKVTDIVFKVDHHGQVTVVQKDKQDTVVGGTNVLVVTDRTKPVDTADHSSIWTNGMMMLLSILGMLIVVIKKKENLS